MPRSSILTVFLLVAAGAGPAAAQAKSPYETCLDKARGDPAMLACAKAELARQEDRLEAAESKLAGTIPAGVKPAYAAANDAWRKFREAQCAWDRASAGKGAAADFAETDCRAGMTEARASELEARAAPADAPPKR
jgi:uncharacterized protein YecT (DUF1311 family)